MAQEMGARSMGVKARDWFSSSGNLERIEFQPARIVVPELSLV